MVEPHELPSVGCRAEGLLMSVHLANLRVTRNESGHETATAHTANVMWHLKKLYFAMKRLKVIILLGLSIVFEMNSQKFDFNIGKVIIAGHVNLNDSSSSLISLSYSGSTDRCDYLTAIVDKSGDFKFEFEILHSQDVLIKYERGRARLIVHLNDSLFLRIDADDFKKEVYPLFEVIGGNPKTNENIQKYLRFKQNSIHFKTECANKSVKQYLNDIRQNIKLQNLVLDSFKLQNNPTPEFINWATKDIVYSNANYLVDFKLYHFINKTTYSGDLFDTTLFPVNDDSALISSMYYMHLWQYVINYCQKDSHARALLTQNKLDEAYNISLNNFIGHEEAGKSRDIMCYQMLSDLLKEPKDEFSKIGKKINLFVQSPILIKLLKKRQEENLLQSHYQTSLFDKQTKETKEIMGDVFFNIKDKYKGKVVFLDFWATWCSPCRSEIPYSIELQSYFKDKDIIFVNICMSSNETEWKNMVETLDLKGENYFLNNDQTVRIKDKLKISGFPTYMIIDKVGHIASRNAPRPSSDKEIKAILTNLLQQ